MTHSTLVYVLDTADELLIDTDRCFLMQPLVLHNVIKKLPIDTVFHDQEQLTFGFNYLKCNFRQKLGLTSYN